MTLKEHYKSYNKKSIKPFFKLLFVFFLVITVSQTFARYTHTINSNGIISVAKWHIEINEEEITNTTNNLNKNIELLNVKDNTTNIDSGDECYFDIIINPSTTEVSITYSITVDFNESNLPEGTKITKYEKYINIGENETKDATENVNNDSLVISENISLSETKIAHDNKSIRRYRIYLKIPFPIDININDNYIISPRIIVKQYIK